MVIKNKVFIFVTVMENKPATKVVKISVKKKNKNKTFLGMRTIQQIIRNEVKAMIIANNGRLVNSHLSQIYYKYRNVADVTMVQNAISYFRYSPQQASFRTKYNF